MTGFIAILVVGIGTYVFRAVFIVGLAGRAIPPRVVRALEYVGPAVLSALVVALLVDDSGTVSAGVPEVGSIAVGALVGWRTRNLIYTVVVGMVVFWVLGIWL